MAATTKPWDPHASHTQWSLIALADFPRRCVRLYLKGMWPEQCTSQLGPCLLGSSLAFGRALSRPLVAGNQGQSWLGACPRAGAWFATLPACPLAGDVQALAEVLVTKSLIASQAGAPWQAPCELDRSHAVPTAGPTYGVC